MTDPRPPQILCKMRSRGSAAGTRKEEAAWLAGKEARAVAMEGVKGVVETGVGAGVETVEVRAEAATEVARVVAA